MYIDSYHTMKDDSNYTFFGDNKRTDELYLGFELEVDGENDERDEEDWEDSASECTDDIADATHDAPDIESRDFFHFEEDGSLDNGFEIISQPASLSTHLKNLEPNGLYSKVCKICTSYGYTSHDNGNCGLHIHLDKEYFHDCLDSASAKLLFLFERHWDKLLKFSRRRSDRWCHSYLNECNYLIDGRANYKGIIENAKDGNIGRYYAVNLSNDDTIEIRLWRGTLNVATLRATIKLTARLAKLAKETSAVALAAMSWSDLLGDDEDILAYARSRNLI